MCLHTVTIQYHVDQSVTIPSLQCYHADNVHPNMQIILMLSTKWTVQYKREDKKRRKGEIAMANKWGKREREERQKERNPNPLYGTRYLKEWLSLPSSLPRKFSALIVLELFVHVFNTFFSVIKIALKEEFSLLWGFYECILCLIIRPIVYSLCWFVYELYFFSKSWRRKYDTPTTFENNECNRLMLQKHTIINISDLHSIL